MFNVNKFAVDNCAEIFCCVNLGKKLLYFLKNSHILTHGCLVQGISAQLAPTLAPGTIASEGSDTGLCGQLAPVSVSLTEAMQAGTS